MKVQKPDIFGLRKLGGCKPHSIEQRFDAAVMPEPNSGCWFWIGAVSACGYGVLKKDRKMYRAHRFSWMRFRGEIPDGLMVCHKCDNPLCVRPEHLFLGTGKANMEDCVSKRRTAVGEQQGLAKLTWEKVDQIRSLNLPQREIAKMFGVSQKAVALVLHNKTWIRQTV